MRYKTKLFKATNNATPGRHARVTANEPYRKQYVNSMTTDKLLSEMKKIK